MIDDNEDVVCIEAPVPTNARTPHPGARNGGAVQVRLMVKVRSPHLLPFEQENSRSIEALPVSMYSRKNGRLSAVIRPAAARYLTQKTLNLIFASKLAN